MTHHMTLHTSQLPRQMVGCVTAGMHGVHGRHTAMFLCCVCVTVKCGRGQSGAYACISCRDAGARWGGRSAAPCLEYCTTVTRCGGQRCRRCTPEPDRPTLQKSFSCPAAACLHQTTQIQGDCGFWLTGHTHTLPAGSWLAAWQ